MGASQRTKGAAGEREWCAMLRAAGYETAARQLGQARDGGGDVIVPPFLYEVKRRRGIAALAWLDQATAALPSHPEARIPVVAMRADHGEWAVMLRATDFLTLVRLADPARR